LGELDLSWNHHGKKADCVASVKLNQDDLRHSTPTFGTSYTVNDHLNLRSKLTNWHDLAFSGTVKVNEHVKVGFGTQLEVSKEGVKAVTGVGSFRLPVGFSIHLKSWETSRTLN